MRYQHTVWKHFNQLHQIRYINTNICVAAYSSGWERIFVFKAAQCDGVRLLVIYMQEPIWRVLSFVVHIKHIYTHFERLCTRLRLRKERKMEQNYLDAFTFLWYSYGLKTAVLYMLFWTPDLSFNIDLGLMSPWTRKLCYLDEKRHLNLDGLN